jgi:FKBP-type peptidyl-prolyl cis-trans isomerase FklB
MPAGRRLAAALLLFGTVPLWVGAEPTGVPQSPAAAPEQPAATGGVQLPTADEAGYTFGLEMGEQLRQYGVTSEIPIERIVAGLKAGLSGAKAEPVDQQKVQAFLRSVTEAVAARNAVAAQEFLARNQRSPGVQTTASGLQYKVLAAGDTHAAAVQPSDQVTVQYRGRLLDGTEFDSSYARGAAATFQVSSVIKGWQEALGMMKPGARWELYIPPELAYGLAPRPRIPGGSLLILDVQLKGVKAPQVAARAVTEFSVSR